MPLEHSLRIQLKKVFKGKEKKNVLTIFFIPKVITLIVVKILIAIKVIKTFFNWILNECSKSTR